MKGRNGTIDFFRFVFAVGILFVHANANKIIPIMPNGWTGVEFFFLVTGWLMCDKSMKAEHDITVNGLSRYIKHKVSGFYPEAIVSLVLGGVSVVFCCTEMRAVLSEFAYTVLDSLLLQVIIGIASPTGGVMA